MITATWKLGIYKGVDANAVASELSTIPTCTPESMVNFARSNPESELHKCFEWNDGVAAEKYRQVQEKLIPAPTGSPVISYMTQFDGWSASFTFRYIENYYSLEQIINFINYAGFSIGIGSGRPGKTASDYGMYHIESIS